MPNSSKKSKEETWTEKELSKAIQGDGKEKKHRSKEKDTKEMSHSKKKGSNREVKENITERNEDTDKKRDSRGEKDSRSSKEREKERKRRKDKEEAGERDRKHRGKENGVIDQKEEQRQDKDSEKEKRYREKDGNNKERRKHREKEDKERSEHKDKEHRKHREDKQDKRRHKEESKERDGSGKHRESRDKDSKVRKNKEGESSNKERDSSSKDHKKRREKSKEDQVILEKERERQRILEIQRLQEEEKRRKEEEDAADYEYDDDFDDYDDDEFEEDDQIEESKNEGQPRSTNDSKSTNNNDGIGKENISPENSLLHLDGIRPQESYFQMTKSQQENLKEVLRAISAENEKASFVSTRPPKDESKKIKKKKDVTEEESSTKKLHGKINFVAASKKQMNDKVAHRTRKRGEELLKLIQLDVRSINLFDMPPMTEYELYMKRFGSSDSKQMFTQTNDECYEKEVQTDEIEVDIRWCQHSDDIRTAGSVKETSVDTQGSIDTFLNADSARLNKFLLRASKVCLSLIEEIEAGIEQPRKQYVETRSPFSDGYVSLGSTEFLVLGRDVCDMAFSTSQTNMLLTAHGTSNVVKKDLKSSKGLLCVWNTNEPTKPSKLLTCESVPRSCCFGSGPASYAFAGMEDGVIAVWDLNEPSYQHELCQIGTTTLMFQTVTFTTAALPEKHTFPVVAITPLTSSTGANINESMDMSFQLATMDQSATVYIWILVRTQGINSFDLASVGDDLGLSPHGRVKLVQSAVINAPGASVSSFTHLFTMTCLTVDEGDINHMYAGTHQGEILHLTRFGNRPTPKSYSSGGGSCRVNAIDVCPWKLPYMLVCYEDGCVRLFHLRNEKAILTWSNTSNGVNLIDVKWSRSRPSVFYTMDSDSVLYAWNLLESEVDPLFKLKIQRKDKRAVGFALANINSVSGRGKAGRASEMALIFGDGSVEIHRLNKSSFNPFPDELERIEAFLADVT